MTIGRRRSERVGPIERRAEGLGEMVGDFNEAKNSSLPPLVEFVRSRRLRPQASASAVLTPSFVTIGEAALEREFVAAHAFPWRFLGGKLG